jgi:gamma-glutamyl hydrolase
MAIIEMPGKHNLNYIHWLESVGIVPLLIPYDLPKDDLFTCLEKVDGVLWTGGAIEKSKYDAVRSIYINTLHTTFEVAKRYNDAGRRYPIFGICQGFEFLVLFHNGNKDILSLPKKLADETTPITFTGKSSLRTWFEPLEKEMASKPCSVQHHTYGVDIKPIPGINILSTQDDYVNIIEYKKYPFYGVHFHPERPFDAFSAKVSVHLGLFLLNVKVAIAT